MSTEGDALLGAIDDYLDANRSLFDVLPKNKAVVENLDDFTARVEARLAAIEASLGAGGGETETADGTPPTPGAITITDLGNGSIRLTAADPGQPWTQCNWFRYAAADSPDESFTQVGTSASPSIVIAAADSGWYSLGLQNTNSNGTWYSHKSPRAQFSAAGAPATITPADGRVITWVTPDYAFGSFPTNGRYQCDQVSNLNSLPTDAPAITGATHSTTGIIHPDGVKSGGSAADSAYALKRTTLGGRKRFYHRIGPGMYCPSLSDPPYYTYRAEIGSMGGTIERGQEFWAAFMFRLLPTAIQAAAPWLSFCDLHHPLDVPASGYGGPSPFGMYGDRTGIVAYWRRGVGGSWADGGTPNVGHSFVPEAGKDYWWVLHGKHHYASGNGAFLELFGAIDDEAPTRKFRIDQPWGVDGSPSQCYLKQGMYAWSAISTGNSANDLCERYGAGLIVTNGNAGTPTLTADVMLASLRAAVA